MSEEELTIFRRIKLTHGQFAVVDEDNFESINAHRWSARWNRGTCSYYAARSSPRKNGKQHTIFMHHAVLMATPGEYVDHKNHDTLDNRRQNLRLCKQNQNCSNRRRRSDNTSGLKGTTWRKDRNIWQAQIMANGKQNHLGYYTSREDAGRAYDVAAIRLHGEFALTNRMLGLIP